MKLYNTDILLIKLESITNLLTLLEESFSINHNTQSESVMKALKILLKDLEKEIWEISEESHT